jgi:hypothetical protein
MAGRNGRSWHLRSLARVTARRGIGASVSNAQGQGAAVAASGSGLAARVVAPVPGTTELRGVAAVGCLGRLLAAGGVSGREVGRRREKREREGRVVAEQGEEGSGDCQQGGVGGG